MSAAVPAAPPVPEGVAVPVRRSRAVRALGTALLTLSGVLLLGTLALPLLGLRLLVVESGSMAPDLPQGALAVARHTPVAELEAGQVISFYPPTRQPVLTTHRVVSVDRTRGGTIVTTRGDANPGDDPWAAELIGERCWVVVAALPGVGRVADLLRSPAGLVLGAFVLPGVFLVSTLRLIWRSSEVPVDRPGGRRRATRRSRRPVERAATVLAAGLAFSVVLGVAGEAAQAAFTASVGRGHTVATAVLRAPTGLVLRNTCMLTVGGVEATWTSASPGATGHRVERRRAGTTTWSTLATVAGTNSHRDTTTSPLVSYEYRVVPYRGTWTGAAATATITTVGTC